MRFGMCMGVDSHQNIKIAKDAGFDYIECNFNSLSRADEETFEKFKEALNDCNIRCEAANCFMPSDLPIIGHDYGRKKYRDFIENGMIRGKKIGLEVIVFGSGAARSIPDGTSYAEGFKQLGDFLASVVSPLAERYGMTVVMEPLRKNECNIINTVKEGVMLAVLSGKSNIACLADLYHMEFDDNDDIRQLKGSIKHAHFSNPVSANGLKRCFPKGFEEYDYQAFIDALKYADCERCSVEANCQCYETEAIETGELIKKLR